MKFLVLFFLAIFVTILERVLVPFLPWPLVGMPLALAAAVACAQTVPLTRALFFGTALAFWGIATLGPSEWRLLLSLPLAAFLSGSGTRLLLSDASWLSVGVASVIGSLTAASVTGVWLLLTPLRKEEFLPLGDWGIEIAVTFLGTFAIVGAWLRLAARFKSIT